MSSLKKLPERINRFKGSFKDILREFDTYDCDHCEVIDGDIDCFDRNIDELQAALQNVDDISRKSDYLHVSPPFIKNNVQKVYVLQYSDPKKEFIMDFKQVINEDDAIRDHFSRFMDISNLIYNTTDSEYNGNLPENDNSMSMDEDEPASDDELFPNNYQPEFNSDIEVKANDEGKQEANDEAKQEAIDDPYDGDEDGDSDIGDIPPERVCHLCCGTHM